MANLRLWEPRRLRGTYTTRDYLIKTPGTSTVLQTDQQREDDAADALTLGVAKSTKHRPQAVGESSETEELPMKSSPQKSCKRKSTRKKQPKPNKRSAAAAVASGHVLSKLWEPPNVTRTKNDLSELDVCLTLYNQEMQQAIEDEEVATIREAMYIHLKKTRRAMLSHIKNVHMFHSIRLKLKQARAWQKKLQKAIDGSMQGDS